MDGIKKKINKWSWMKSHTHKHTHKKKIYHAKWINKWSDLYEKGEQKKDVDHSVDNKYRKKNGAENRMDCLWYVSFWCLCAYF